MKRSLTVILAIILFLSNASFAFAHENQNEHDGDLKYALFGDRDKVLQGDEKIAFQAIADAAAICIDQFSPNSELGRNKSTFEKLQRELKDLGLAGLSISFESIDLNKDNVNSDKNITANSHRRYTHSGWNYKKYPNMEFWMKRRDVLRFTVSRVLFPSSISRIPWVANTFESPSEQCDAFCALVYYIHILGDHIEGDIPDKLTDLEPLVHYSSFTLPGIIPEICEYLQVCFPSQRSSWTYLSLQQDLEALCIDAEKNCGTWGSIDTEEKCKTNQDYAKRFLDILADNLPTLLKNEGFFTNTFKQS